MQWRSCSKLVAAGVAVTVPPMLFAVCLVFSGVEAWKLWREISLFAPLGVIVWLWLLAYVVAVIVTIGRLDDEPHLPYWELVIDASNTVTSVILAFACADELGGRMGDVPFLARAGSLLVLCLIAQFIVAFAARRGRQIAGRLFQELIAQKAAPEPPAQSLASDTPYPRNDPQDIEIVADVEQRETEFVA
jgi:hypothetical protein